MQSTDISANDRVPGDGHDFDWKAKTLICNCLENFANSIISATYLTCGALRDPETLGQRALSELFHVMAVTLSLIVDAASCFQFIWSPS